MVRPRRDPVRPATVHHSYGMHAGLRYLLLALCSSSSHALKMCNICVSTSCEYRGARLFESAVKALATPDVNVGTPGCLRKCGQGVVLKAFGGLCKPAPAGLFAWYPVVDDEAEAVRAACDLLTTMDGLDEEKRIALVARLEAGERVLENDPPRYEARCENCGAGLVSERTSSSCAACSGTGKRVWRGQFGEPPPPSGYEPAAPDEAEE